MVGDSQLTSDEHAAPDSGAQESLELFRDKRGEEPSRRDEALPNSIPMAVRQKFMHAAILPT